MSSCEYPQQRVPPVLVSLTSECPWRAFSSQRASVQRASPSNECPAGEHPASVVSKQRVSLANECLQSTSVSSQRVSPVNECLQSKSVSSPRVSQTSECLQRRAPPANLRSVLSGRALVSVCLRGSGRGRLLLDGRRLGGREGVFELSLLPLSRWLGV